jgi:hypothetical protein
MRASRRGRVGTEGVGEMEKGQRVVRMETAGLGGLTGRRVAVSSVGVWCPRR